MLYLLFVNVTYFCYLCGIHWDRKVLWSVQITRSLCFFTIKFLVSWIILWTNEKWVSARWRARKYSWQALFARNSAFRSTNFASGWRRTVRWAMPMWLPCSTGFAKCSTSIARRATLSMAVRSGRSAPRFRQKLWRKKLISSLRSASRKRGFFSRLRPISADWRMWSSTAWRSEQQKVRKMVVRRKERPRQR